MLIRKSVGVHTIKPDKAYYRQTSNRLLFRSFKNEDIQDWLAFFKDDDAYYRFLGADQSIPKLTRATNWVEKQIERMMEGEFGQLAVIEESSGQLIGLGGIIPREFGNNYEYEITYSLIPQYWRKGYAIELAQHFRDYAKSTMPIQSVISMIHPNNAPSIKVAEKNAMILDGEHFIFGMTVLVYRYTF